MAVREPEIRNVMTAFYKDSTNTFKQQIEEGIESGRFKNTDSEKVSRALYLLFMGVFFTHFSINVDFDLMEQQKFQLDNILNSIKKI